MGSSQSRKYEKQQQQLAKIIKQDTQNAEFYLALHIKRRDQQDNTTFRTQIFKPFISAFKAIKSIKQQLAPKKEKPNFSSLRHILNDLTKSDEFYLRIQYLAKCEQNFLYQLNLNNLCRDECNKVLYWSFDKSQEFLKGQVKILVTLVNSYQEFFIDHIIKNKELKTIQSRNKTRNNAFLSQVKQLFQKYKNVWRKSLQYVNKLYGIQCTTQKLQNLLENTFEKSLRQKNYVTECQNIIECLIKYIQNQENSFSFQNAAPSLAHTQIQTYTKNLFSLINQKIKIQEHSPKIIKQMSSLSFKKINQLVQTLGIFLKISISPLGGNQNTLTFTQEDVTKLILLIQQKNKAEKKKQQVNYSHQVPEIQVIDTTYYQINYKQQYERSNNSLLQKQSIIKKLEKTIKQIQENQTNRKTQEQQLLSQIQKLQQNQSGSQSATQQFNKKIDTLKQEQEQKIKQLIAKSEIEKVQILQKYNQLETTSNVLKEQNRKIILSHQKQISKITSKAQQTEQLHLSEIKLLKEKQTAQFSEKTLLLSSKFDTQKSQLTDQINASNDKYNQLKDQYDQLVSRNNYRTSMYKQLKEQGCPISSLALDQFLQKKIIIIPQQEIKTNASKLKQELKKEYQPQFQQLNQKQEEFHHKNQTLTSENQQLKQIIQKLKDNLNKNNQQSRNQIDRLASNQRQYLNTIIQLQQKNSQLQQSQSSGGQFWQSEKYHQLLTQKSNLLSELPLYQPYFKAFFNQDVFLNDQINKEKLISHLQNYTGSRITRTALLHKYDKRNKANFHQYIDQVKGLVIVVKTKNAIVAGFYPEVHKDKQVLNKGGLLVSVTNDQSYRLFTKKPSDQSKTIYRGMIYDTYFAIFGNAQIRVKTGFKTVFSNFGVSNGYFDSRGDRIDKFFNQGDTREIQFQFCEFYQINFERQFKDVELH